MKVAPAVPSLGGDELSPLEPGGLEELFPVEKEEEGEKVSVSRIPSLELLELFPSCSGMWKVSSSLGSYSTPTLD